MEVVCHHLEPCLSALLLGRILVWNCCFIMSHFKEGIWKDHASIESLISFHFLNVYMLLKPLFIFSYFEFNCWFSHKMLLKQVKHISKFSCSPMMFIATFEYMKLSNFLCQNPNKVIHNAPRIIGDPSPCPAPSPPL